MKKIMIALAAVAMAVAANAAAITWGSSAITKADGSSAKATVTAYLLSTTAKDYTKYSTITTGEALSLAIANDYASSLSSLTGTQSSSKSIANLKDSADYAVNATAYAVVLYTYNDGTKDLYMGNVATYTFDAANDFTVGNMSKYIGGGDSGTATAWTAVPEPTSGLLLLLGMAGLALRRKHV